MEFITKQANINPLKTIEHKVSYIQKALLWIRKNIYGSLDSLCRHHAEYFAQRDSELFDSSFFIFFYQTSVSLKTSTAIATSLSA